MSLYRPVTIGSLELPGNLFLAPVAGYTGRAFRSICAEMGADYSFTELISAEAISRNPQGYSSAVLAKRGIQEKRYCVQLFGSDPDVLGRACAQLAPLQPDAADLNAGCPAAKVVKAGAGSALMKDPKRLARIIESMARASRETLGGIPVTVKIRSGWDASSINYLECARAAVEAGAMMISLHPRTRVQGYSGKSNWRHIADLASRLSVPVVGSGDLYTPEDASRMLKETACAALMFARGAMGNPCIFTMTRSFLLNGDYTPPGREERLQTALRHLEMLAEDIGESRACREMRKQLCAYTKGMAGGASLREKIVHAQTIEEYKKIIELF